MTGIFINYRVGRTGTVAHLLYQRLAEVFDSTQIYFASENNIPGRPFDTAILDAIRTCDVLLTVIGPDWHTVTDRSTGTRRLWDHEDWVRREIVEALARGIPVIPVLIDGANLPDADELPEDLRDLPRMHYVRLGHRIDDPDIADLIAATRRAAPGLATPGAPDEHTPNRSSPDTAVQNATANASSSAGKSSLALGGGNWGQVLIGDGAMNVQHPVTHVTGKRAEVFIGSRVTKWKLLFLPFVFIIKMTKSIGSAIVAHPVVAAMVATLLVAGGVSGGLISSQTPRAPIMQHVAGFTAPHGDSTPNNGKTVQVSHTSSSTISHHVTPNISGSYSGSFTNNGLSGNPPMRMVLTQRGSALNGQTTEGATVYIDTGTINPDGTFHITETYSTSTGTGTVDLYGSILPNGGIGGTWTGNPGGTWTLAKISTGS